MSRNNLKRSKSRDLGFIDLKLVPMNCGQAELEVKGNPAKVVEYAPKSKLFLSRLVHGVGGLPVALYPAAANIFISAVRRILMDDNIEDICEIIDAASPFLLALISLRGDFSDWNGLAQANRVLELWPVLFDRVQQIARTILHHDEDFDDERNGATKKIEFVIIAYAVMTFCGDNGRRILQKQSVCEVAMIIWLHSYRSISAQVMAAHLLTDNYAVYQDTTDGDDRSDDQRIEQYREILCNVVKKMRMDARSVVRMTLKRLIKSTNHIDPNHHTLGTKTFRADYHLTTFVMMLNPGATGRTTPFSSVFEEEGGPLIVSHLLSQAVRSSRDYRDDFIGASLSALATSLQCSSHLNTICRALRCDTLEVLSLLTRKLASHEPSRGDQVCILDVLVDTTAFFLVHVIPELLLFYSITSLFKNTESGAYLSTSGSSVLDRAWRALLPIYTRKSIAYDLISSLVKISKPVCANPKCRADKDGNLLVCEGCEMTAYCSRSCQVVAWKEAGHSSDCREERCVVGGTSLNSKDVVMLATLAFFCARSQIARFEPPEGDLGIIIDLSTEACDGSLQLTLFDSGLRDEFPTFNLFSFIDVKLNPNAPLKTAIIRVVYTLFQETRRFAFRAVFEQGIFDGSACSCCPFPLCHRPTCIQHNIH
ncbi:hypothetical protein SCHPADRAFT_1003197 [Schizopora paradoxa]|uniref:MYND-type domain-containing protein n=1 Tax=Schizopora paradoxa TaxID=27342 RepID=A0A0H2R0I9_9AGAM|nr:hypothetical protein SCHPADRAFT_1003197 [Schizopora paradoxa]